MIPLLLTPSTLPLLIAPFKHIRFLCCSRPYFGASTVSANNFSSFNIFFKTDKIFITDQNCYHMTNNMTYMGIINASNSDFFNHFFKRQLCQYGIYQLCNLISNKI